MTLNMVQMDSNFKYTHSR